MQYHPIEINDSDTCKTKDCLAKTLRIDPKNVKAHWILGTLYQREENYQNAIEELTVAVQLAPSYNLGYPYRDRANCKNNLGNDTGAVNDMNEAIKFNPTERYFYIERASYLHNLDKLELALKDYDRALEIWSEFRSARIERAKVLVELKQYKKALKDYNILKDGKDFSDYDFYYRGIAKYNMNETGGACKDWQSVANTCKEAKNSLEKYCKTDK